MTRHAAPALLTILLGHVALAAAVAVVVSVQGCGDDDDVSIDGAVRDAAVESGDGGAGTAGKRANAAGTGGRRATPRAGDGGKGGSAGAAGEDTAAGGTGGRVAADSGIAGRRPETEPPSSDDGSCPTLDFGGLLVLPSCCTSRRMCGVDTSMVGGPGCLDLATAADRARMSGASVIFPAPRACEAEPSDVDTDAGSPDDAGSE